MTQHTDSHPAPVEDAVLPAPVEAPGGPPVEEPRGAPAGQPADRPRGAGVSRRRFFTGAAGGLALGGAAGAGATALVGRDRSGATASDTGAVQHAFYATSAGAPQAGIATPQQKHSLITAFDLTTPTPSALQVLLARWSAGIAQLMAGRPVGQVDPTGAGAVADDTGEGVGLGPYGLTVTVGLGPGVFDGRFGLAGKKPALLAELPALPSDQLQDGLVGGDISLQACADDPQIAYHAIRNLARMARDSVAPRWTVMGFGRASASAGQQTPRNLMGFKDGTRNIKTPAELQQHVWVRGGDQAWMDGGAYQVVRKIHMNIEIWDSDRVADQQDVIGRHKASGAPLGAHAEFDRPDFAAARTVDGERQPVIPAHAHIRLAAHENNGGKRLLRRSYNYTDGIDAVGQQDAGLLFVAYMNDPATFVDLQTKLGSSDALNEYIAHVGSGIFAVPPAPRRGGYLGQALFT